MLLGMKKRIKISSCKNIQKLERKSRRKRKLNGDENENL